MLARLFEFVGENRRLRVQLARERAKRHAIAENHVRALTRLEVAAIREAALFAKVAELEATNAALVSGIRVFDGENETS